MAEKNQDSRPIRGKNGWDGKLRIAKAQLDMAPGDASPPASDAEDEDAGEGEVDRQVEIVHGEQIDADEGESKSDLACLGYEADPAASQTFSTTWTRRRL